MAIPLFIGADEQLRTLDDRTVYTDDGSGYEAWLVGRPIWFGLPGTLGRLRRFDQVVECANGVTVDITAIKDGQESGVTISRVCPGNVQKPHYFPLAVSGSRFGIKLELVGFTDEVLLGSAALWLLPRRTR